MGGSPPPTQADSMLQPIRRTDARLNSLTEHPPQKKVNKEKKSVQFNPQSISLLSRNTANRAVLCMDQHREAKKPRTKSRPSTPAEKPSEVRYKSASGWRLEDLQNCSVEVEQHVDPLKMIPPKFFNFEHEHLEQYADGSSAPISTYL